MEIATKSKIHHARRRLQRRAWTTAGIMELIVFKVKVLRESSLLY
jgi:hypothetical protein